MDNFLLSTKFSSNEAVQQWEIAGQQNQNKKQ